MHYYLYLILTRTRGDAEHQRNRACIDLKRKRIIANDVTLSRATQGTNPKDMKKEPKQYWHYSEKEIDFEEFYNLILKLRKEEEERLALLHIFQILDKNDDGRLTVDEIIYILLIIKEGKSFTVFKTLSDFEEKILIRQM